MKFVINVNGSLRLPPFYFVFHSPLLAPPSLFLFITQPLPSNICYSSGCLLPDFSSCTCDHTNESVLLLIL